MSAIINYRACEDDTGELYLVAMRDDEIIWSARGYATGAIDLLEDINRIEAGENPTDWDFAPYQKVEDALTLAGYACDGLKVIATRGFRLPPEECASSARRAFYGEGVESR